METGRFNGAVVDITRNYSGFLDTNELKLTLRALAI